MTITMTVNVTVITVVTAILMLTMITDSISDRTSVLSLLSVTFQVGLKVL